ncbi:MAG: NahK/ErcS family hybrid sensor histidine kinase/response regulator, partial [Hyphomicrobiales bacterium]
NIFEETFFPTGQILEVRTNRMPDGGIVVTYTDVSERAANKRTLEEVNQALEERVKVRTEELTRLNGQLELASQMAHEANVGKTKFLAAAGHDILQPLNAARLYTTALSEILTDERHLKSANNIEAALGSVEDILSTLLDISRLDAGATTTEITVVRLDELLEQLQVEFSPMAEAKNLTFHVIKSGLHVRSDRRLLRRLLQNLISNAIKYTPRGRVTVGCRRHEHTTTLHIYDTGIGIPFSKQKEIFCEFQRLESGIKAGPGLGLGLSIVERLSEILKHPIDLQSRIGMGTRFSVTLPLARALALPQKAKPKPAVPLARLEGTLILCIDNEAQILDGMRNLLEGWGCRILTASDQEEATIVIEAERKRSGDLPDVILVDYHLDGNIRGVEVLARLRWRFESGLPGILITADRTTRVRDEASAKNMPILNKPLKPAALRSLLQQLAKAGHHKTNAPAAE